MLELHSFRAFVAELFFCCFIKLFLNKVERHGNCAQCLLMLQNLVLRLRCFLKCLKFEIWKLVVVALAGSCACHICGLETLTKLVVSSLGSLATCFLPKCGASV